MKVICAIALLATVALAMPQWPYFAQKRPGLARTEDDHSGHDHSGHDHSSHETGFARNDSDTTDWGLFPNGGRPLGLARADAMTRQTLPPYPHSRPGLARTDDDCDHDHSDHDGHDDCDHSGHDHSRYEYYEYY